MPRRIEPYIRSDGATVVFLLRDQAVPVIIFIEAETTGVVADKKLGDVIGGHEITSQQFTKTGDPLLEHVWVHDSNWHQHVGDLILIVVGVPVRMEDTRFRYLEHHAFDVGHHEVFWFERTKNLEPATDVDGPADVHGSHLHRESDW